VRMREANVETNTTLPSEPLDTGEVPVVETEVEAVRTRRRVVGAPGEAVPVPRVIAHESSGTYFETLPERLGGVAVLVLATLEVLLGMRFVLRAYAANPSNSFVRFIDNLSWPFARPFANVFSTHSWSQGVLEVSTLVAMGVYLLLFALIGMMVTALAPRIHGGTGGAA
jgi:hypothetical protein